MMALSIVLFVGLVAPIAASVFKDLKGLKPFTCTSQLAGAAAHPGCLGDNQVAHKFHHLDDAGRFTGLHFDLTHHPNLHLLDNHADIGNVVCAEDHIVVTKQPGKSFPWSEGDYTSGEDHYVTGSILHACPDGMPLRRRIESVEYLPDGQQARIQTSEAGLHDLVEDGSMKFYTNDFGEPKNPGGTDLIANPEPGTEMPHEYYEYDYDEEDGSWGTPTWDSTSNRTDTDRELLRHHHHHHHHHHHGFFHRVFHKVGHFFKKVGHAIKKVVTKVAHVVKDVVCSAVNLTEFAFDTITGHVFKKSFKKHKTFGWNYDEHTHSAKKPITLNKGGAIPVHCNNCYAEMDFGLDAELKLKRFKVEQASLTISGREHVHISANAALGKTISHKFGPHSILKMGLARIHFFIGPVPVFIDFDLDVEVGGSLAFSASATADTDIDDLRQVKLGWSYGPQIPSDWPRSGIKNIHDKVKKLVWFSVKDNTADVNGHFELDISISLFVQPKISVSIDKILFGSVAVTPTITADLAISDDFHAGGTYSSENRHLLDNELSPAVVAPADRELEGFSLGNDLEFDLRVTIRIEVEVAFKLLSNSVYHHTWKVYDSGEKTLYHKHWTKKVHKGHAAHARHLLDSEFRVNHEYVSMSGLAGRALLDDTTTKTEPEREPMNVTDLTDEERSGFVCPLNEVCIVASGLKNCAQLNGQRVCASEDLLAELDNQVGEYLMAMKPKGPACMRQLAMLQCEKTISVCDPVPYKHTVTKICHDQCMGVYGVCGYSPVFAHGLCSAQSSQFYSPIAPPSTGMGAGAAASCKALSTTYDDVMSQEEGGVCELAEDLKHCPMANGKMIHYDRRFYSSLREVDEFVNKLFSKSAEDDLLCPSMAKAMLCAEFLPECVWRDDLDTFYETNNITDSADMWDYFDDPHLPKDDFHIILPMCHHTCRSHLNKCQDSANLTAQYCDDQTNPLVSSIVAPQEQQACGHRLERIIEQPVAPVVNVVMNSRGTWKTWEVSLVAAGSTLGAMVLTAVATAKWQSRKRHKREAEAGLQMYSNIDGY